MFVRVLESLDQPQSLVHRSSHGKVIHGDLPQDAFTVDDEETSEHRRIVFWIYVKLYRAAKMKSIIIQSRLGSVTENKPHFQSSGLEGLHETRKGTPVINLTGLQGN